MKKKVLIIILVLVLIVGGIGIYLNRDKLFKAKDKDKDKEETKEVTYVSTIDKDVYKYLSVDDKSIVTDVNTEEVVYNPSKKYSKDLPSKISFINNISMKNAGEIEEYLKYFLWVFREQSKDSFSDIDKSIIISLKADMIYEPKNTAYINKLAKQYFNDDEFTFVTGTYKTYLTKDEILNYSIMKQNDYYIMGGLVPSDFDSDYYETITDIKTNDNKVTIYYDYISNTGKCATSEEDEKIKEECKSGEYIVNLTVDKKSDVFAVNSIEYKKVK